VEADDRAVVLILLIGEASGVFAGFCPSWFTVASPFFHEQAAKAGNVKRIRWGEVAATLIVISTGAAVSYQQRDPFPLVASALIAAVFIAGYEYQIAHPSTEDADNGAALEQMQAGQTNTNGAGVIGQVWTP
jgi:hypothetical protein